MKLQSLTRKPLLFALVLANGGLLCSQHVLAGDSAPVQEVTQQKNLITGVVTDAKGEPVIGASIKVKGTSEGTITDISGNFKLSVAPGRILEVTYVGYTPKTVSVAPGATRLNVQLEENTEALDEVVVIGYGTQRKGDVTSSISSLKEGEFNQGAVKDVGQLIQGKIAGLAITNASGDPTATTTIRLRGTNTLNGANTTPLVLIDGVPGTLDMVAPEDVESVDVLKDGSAAAIYGTRGTNGVILITTKQAKGVDMNRVTYNGYVSTSTIARKLDMLSADEFRQLYPEYDHGANTDWVKEITRIPVTHVHDLSLVGGNSKTNYIANLNYASKQGIMLKSNYESFQGRIEINHHMFGDKLLLKFGIFGKKGQYESTSSGGSFRGYAFSQATRYNPTDPVRNEDGSWFQNVSKFEYENPVSLLEECDGNVKRTRLRFNGNITFTPIKDLRFNALISYDRNNRNNGYSETKQHISALRDGYNGWTNVGASTSMEKLLELTAQYSKKIKEHSFTVLGGYSYNETDTEGMSATNYWFQDNYFGGWHNIGIGDALLQGKAGMSSNKLSTNLIGFFGRVTYNWNNRYLLMGSLRYEGASQLVGTNNEWGLFPSVSAGWRITEEPFMKNQKIFNDLKLRLGYGVTGSQPSASFLGMAMLGYNGSFPINGQWIHIVSPVQNANPDLKWEEKRETNVGLDFVLLNNRISGSIDFYNRTIAGLLYNYSVPVPPNLYNTTMANGGKLRNRGFEVMLSGIPVQSKDFTWNTTVTFSTNSNKLLSLNGSTFKTDNDYFDTGSVEFAGQTTVSHRVQVGQPIGNFWGFKVVDVDENGKWIYEDRDGKRVGYDDFKRAPEDKHVIGNGLPKWYAGWNNSFRYKNFDLNIVMRGAFGFQIINADRINYENPKNERAENRLKSVTDNVFGKVPLSKEVNIDYNSYYVENGDYWKVDNITLGYTFDIKAKYLRSVRLYASVQNVITITGYKGVDPEVNTSGLTPGYDNRDKFPNIRSYTLGVNVQF